MYSTQKEKRIAYVTMKDPEIARKLGKLGLMTIYGQMVNISPFHKFEPRTSRFDWEQNQEARFATNYSESSPVYDEGRTHSNWYSNADLPIEIPTNQAACIPDVPVEPPFHLQPNCPLEIRNADKQTIFSLEKDPSATTTAEASQLIEIQSSGSKSVPICPKHCHKFKHDIRPTTRSYCFDKVSSANHGSNNLVLNTNITSIPEANPLLGVSEA